MKGVMPDIQIPFFNRHVWLRGEFKTKCAPLGPNKAQSYTPAGNLTPYIPKLIQLHEERIKNNPEFEYLKEDIAESKELNAQKYVSLNEEVEKKKMI